MSKYVPAKFAPVIYRSWANLFKNLTSDQKAEVLMAITLFPDYEPAIEIFAWDYIKAELEQEYEKFLAKKEQAKNARALVDERRPASTEGDERRPASTEGDERRPTSTLVDLVPVPVPVPKKEVKEKVAARTHRFELHAIPTEWRDYCEKVRPDLNPEREFQDFVFYFTQGKGSSKLRSDKGWSQAWQGWVRRSKERSQPAQTTNMFTVVKPSRPANFEDDFDPDFDLANFGVAK